MSAVFWLIVIVSLLSRARSGGTLQATRNRLAATVPVRGLFGVVGFAAVIRLLVERPPMGGTIVCVALAFLGLSIVLMEGTTRALAALGAVRAAWLVDRIALGGTSWREAPATGALAAARALMVRPSEAGARFVERCVERQYDVPMTGIAAHGLVALARGRRDDARSLFSALHRSIHAPAGLRRLAADALAADAAARGDWDRIRTLAPPRGPSARLLRALSASAEEPSTRARLHMLAAWCVAPNRRRTWRLLRRPLPKFVATSAPGFLGGYRDVLATPAHALRAADVIRAAQELDALRGSRDAAAQLARRAMALDATGDVDTLLDDLLGGLEGDLVAHVATSPVELAQASGETYEAIRHRVHTERRDRVEPLLATLAARTRERRDLPERDEWIAWGHVLEVVILARRGQEHADALTLNALAHARLEAWAVRMVNARGMRMLAREVFTLLAMLAKEAAHDDAWRRSERNILSCEALGLPLQRPMTGEPLSSPTLVPSVRFNAWLVLFGAGLVFLASVGTGHGPVVMVSFFVLVPTVFLTFALRARLVELAMEDDRVHIQTAGMRQVVARAEVRARRLGRLALVTLQRRPRSLPRLLWTVLERRDSVDTLRAGGAKRA